MSQMVSLSQLPIHAQRVFSAPLEALIMASISALLEHIVTSSPEHHKVVAASNVYLDLDATDLQWTFTILVITVALTAIRAQ